MQLAMPLFEDVAPITVAAVRAAWQTLFPSGPRLVVAKSDDAVDEYKLDGGRSVLVVQIPKPVPQEEALGAIESSWMWQRSDKPVRSHRAHAIVTASDGDSSLVAAWDVARVSAALLAAGKGAALYWGNSRQMHDPALAIDFASDMTKRPDPLWVGITISGASKKGPFSAATHGLEAFGHKEFEVRDTRMGLGDLRMTLLDLASYVLDNGPVLEHGQTFGPTVTDRWRIAHEPSELVPGRDAIVLGIP
jgi:hypothetical protein